MAANYICIKQKTKVYGEMRLGMVVILGIWVEYMKVKKLRLRLANFHLHN